MFDNIMLSLANFGRKAVEVVKGLSPRQQTGVALGGGILVIGGLAGGLIFQAALGAFIVNTLLWTMIKDSPFFNGLMDKYGGKVDVAITVMGFLGGGTGVVAWLTAIMMGAFFTAFRMALTGVEVVKEKVSQKIKAANNEEAPRKGGQDSNDNDVIEITEWTEVA